MDEIPDTRYAAMVRYDKRFLVWWDIGLFAAKLGSRRQLDFEFRDLDTYVLENVNRLAETQQETLPVHNTLRHFQEHTGFQPIARVRTKMIRRLCRMRIFDNDRLEGYVVVALDATGVLSFFCRHCPHCLTQKHGDKTYYFHPMLEAKIVTHSGLALSIASEPIENPIAAQDTAQAQDYQKIKQDCELKAFARLAPELHREFPQLLLLITGDALYACGTAIQICKKNGWSYIFTFKPGSLPALWEEFQSLLKCCPDNTLKRRLPDGTRQVFRWVNQMAYCDSENREHLLDALMCQETTPSGETTTFAWITGCHVTDKNVIALSERGGRARWKIENEGFNTQKNSGLNLEHVYGKKEVHWKSFYYYLQIGHMMLQVFEKGSLLRKVAADRGKTVLGLLGSLKNIARRFLDCLRYFKIPDTAFDVTLAGRIQIRLDSS